MLIDRIIGAFSPKAAFERASYRRALEIQARGYEAAKRDPKTLSWRATGSSANAEISNDEAIVRNRCRSLVRDNGFARQIVETMADHVVGTGIVGAPNGMSGRNLIRVKDQWSRFVDECDHDGDLDLHGLAWAAVHAMGESGAALIRFHRQKFDGNAKYVPLKLQLIEPDFIDTMKDGTTDSGGFIDRGIEYDSQGRKVAYWLFKRHPGDVSRFRMNDYRSERVPSDEIIYLYEKLRPGQDRGMPILAPSVMPLRDLRGYFEAELTRKRIEACLAAFITSEEGAPLGETNPNEKDENGVQVERFAPGMITRLREGENVTIAQPSHSQGVGEFALLTLREAAAGAGVMYEHATGDFSGVNYSSWRAGHHGFRRRMERKQWHVAIHKMMRPIKNRFCEAGFAAGLIPEDFGWRWTPPGFISVDPKKDSEADLANLRMGKVTLSQLVEANGWDYVEHLATYADDLEKADQAFGGDVMFDGDPRKTPVRAQPSDQAQPDTKI